VIRFSRSPGTLSPANFLCRFAALRLGVFALNPSAPIVHPKMKTGKEPFKCGMRPSSLPSSLRYDAASCFDAARSAEGLNNKATKEQSFAVLVAWFLVVQKTSGRNAPVQI
jgi:hypothetical protein